MTFFELPMGNIKEKDIMEKTRVRELVEYERYCTDYGLNEQREKCWFQDGKIFTTWFKGNVKDYFKAKPTKNVEKTDEKESHGHRINNTMVWINGDKAIAEIMCVLNFRTCLENKWVDIQCNSRMHYRVEKRNGEWGIVYMEGIYEKDRMDSVFGKEPLYIKREQLEKYRSNNFYMAARRDLYEGGLKYSNEWAGKDKPETIKKLYDESSKWIFS